MVESLREAASRDVGEGRRRGEIGLKSASYEISARIPLVHALPHDAHRVRASEVI